ncbi:MAG TPA: acyl carrier protein [Actinomycetota bacterium]|jgi:acyl carrier protein|nr:acyl carrier protein [Actinomycetota bacterium]
MPDRQEIVAVIKEHLEARGIPADVVTPEADLASDVGLDSLDVTELTLGLEERFSIEIPDEELEDVRTIGDAASLVERKVAVGA